MPNYLRSVVVIFALSYPLSTGLHAQTSIAELSAGDRIRVVLPPANRMSGRLIGIVGDSILFSTSEMPQVQLPQSAFLRLEVARPGNRVASARAGALLGGGIGAVLGAVGALASCSVETGNPICIDGLSALMIVAGGSAGAAAGAVFGGAFGGTRWVDVPLSAGP